MGTKKESSLREDIASINQEAMAGLAVAALVADGAHDQHIERFERWEALLEHAMHVKGEIGSLLGELGEEDREHFERQILFTKLAAYIYEMDSPPRGVVEGMLADMLRVRNSGTLFDALRLLSFLPLEKRACEEFLFFLVTPGAKPIGENTVGNHRLPDSRSKRRDMIGAVIARLLISHRGDARTYAELLACLHFHNPVRILVRGR